MTGETEGETAAEASAFETAPARASTTTGCASTGATPVGGLLGVLAALAAMTGRRRNTECGCPTAPGGFPPSGDPARTTQRGGHAESLHPEALDAPPSASPMHRPPSRGQAPARRRRRLPPRESNHGSVHPSPRASGTGVPSRPFWTSTTGVPAGGEVAGIGALEDGGQDHRSGLHPTGVPSHTPSTRSGPGWADPAPVHPQACRPAGPTGRWEPQPGRRQQEGSRRPDRDEPAAADRKRRCSIRRWTAGRYRSRGHRRDPHAPMRPRAGTRKPASQAGEERSSTSGTPSSGPRP